jgi:hypothetical protein
MYLKMKNCNFFLTTTLENGNTSVGLGKGHTTYVQNIFFFLKT